MGRGVYLEQLLPSLMYEFARFVGNYRIFHTRSILSDRKTLETLLGKHSSMALVDISTNPVGPRVTVYTLRGFMVKRTSGL